MNVPEDKSWKCKAYTLGCSVHRIIKQEHRTYVETLKAPQAACDSMSASLDVNWPN